MNIIDLFAKKIVKPYRFRLIKKHVRGQNLLNVLDVGCGARAAEITRNSILVKRYDGVDNQVWHGDEKSYQNIDNFYKLDLEVDDLIEIPNDFYDIVILSHVIEHIANGEQVIERLCTKLKVGGVIYVETPHPRTFNFPSGVGFSNFYDDATHKRIYFSHDILNLMLSIDMKVLGYGTRRDKFRIKLFALPILVFNLIYYLPFKKKPFVKGLWDTLGVAQFWFAKRVK